MLAVLKSFGYAIEQLDGTLSNIMTMQSDVREWFARLEIWSEKIARITPTLPIPSNLTPSQTIMHSLYFRLPPSPDNKNLPVPSETLLALYARSPRFLRQLSTSISKTLSSKTWKFGGSVKLRPLEEHGPNHTTRTKPLSSSPSSSRPDVFPSLRPPTRLLKCSNQPFWSFFFPGTATRMNDARPSK
ncbi:hypothetical protein ARMSODRAFT_1019269 [Armillaria solidipes]|uniref:Uncharacterized protein n=1 Tax=Armillaria solidipes TaxID=1076256 RepID=A0A2H3BCQ1_9AGAR|nr:hypothetical protein ARMSODRAFT_1019269 [Armillaria solidipes]